jgi:hypothetical protein
MLGYALLRYRGTPRDEALSIIGSTRLYTLQGVGERRLAWADQFEMVHASSARGASERSAERNGRSREERQDIKEWSAGYIEKHHQVYEKLKASPSVLSLKRMGYRTRGFHESSAGTSCPPNSAGSTPAQIRYGRIEKPG